MKRCVAYCRVSTDSNEQKTSIENQKAYYLDLFKKEGFNSAECGMIYKKNNEVEDIKGIFADEGISGTSLKNRKAFNKMIEHAKNKDFDIIYVKDIKRFARNIEDGTKIINLLTSLDIEVRFEQGNLSSMKEQERLTINFFLSMAEQESRDKAGRVKDGIRAFQKKGGWNSGTPFGYDIENGFLKVNYNEAKIINEIYNLYYKQGYGLSKIVRYLNKNKIPTKKKVQWSSSQINKILENPLYNGIQRTHIEEMIDITARNSKDFITSKYKSIEAREWIIHEKEELRIVEQELWDKVQIEKEKRKKSIENGVRPSNKHLLSTLIYCGNCGASYKRKKRNSTRDIGYEWTCNINDRYGKDRCSHRNAITEDEIIKRIKKEIIRIRENKLDDIFDIYLDLKFNYDISHEKTSDINEKISILKNKIDKNFDLYSDDSISKEEYVERNKSLNKDLDFFSNELNNIKYRTDMIKSAKIKYNQFIENLNDIDLDNLSNSELKKIFKSIKIGHLSLKNKKMKFIYIEYNYYFMDISMDDLLYEINERYISHGIRTRQFDIPCDFIDSYGNEMICDDYYD